MDMVDHQHKAVNCDTVSKTVLAKLVQINDVVAIGVKSDLSIIAALYQVNWRTGQELPWKTGHGILQSVEATRWFPQE